jgi:hypothetical protein
VTPAGRRLPRRLAATLLLALASALASSCTGARRASEAGSGSGLAAVRIEGTEVPAQPAQERLLIRRASLQLTVEDLDGTRQRAAVLAAASGGYVERSALSAGQSTLADGQRLRITLRVPSAALDAVLDSLARLGDREALLPALTGRPGARRRSRRAGAQGQTSVARSRSKTFAATRWSTASPSYTQW